MDELRQVIHKRMGSVDLLMEERQVPSWIPRGRSQDSEGSRGQSLDDASRGAPSSGRPQGEAGALVTPHHPAAGRGSATLGGQLAVEARVTPRVPHHASHEFGELEARRSS